jgi:quinoprotein glucose dehydrogenase
MLSGAAMALAACSEAPTADRPEYRWIPGLFGERRDGPVPELRSHGVDQSAFERWTRSHGDDGSTKFSNLDQLRPENVDRLEVAWAFDATRHADGMPATWQYPVQANPIVAGRTLYAPTPDDAIVALDAATGALRWEYRASARPAHRGLLFRPEDGEAPPRLYFVEGRRVVALDARTGRPDPSFGDHGSAPVGNATATPAVVGSTLLVTANKPAALHAFSLPGGEPLWETALLRYSGQNSGCSPWGGFSVDAVRGLAFVTTGNPRPAMLGIGRIGPNPHCNSVVAVDTASGDIVWAFQEVAHDLWNFDIAAPPALTTIEIDGRAVDVVAAATKIGNTLLLERDSGEPLFDYRLRRAPPSTIAGETAAAYQPDLVLPEPFFDVAFDEDDITDIDPESRESVRWQLEGAVFGFFAPPTVGHTVVQYGLHGGAEWPGVAIDPERGWLFAPINRIAWKLRVYPRLRRPAPLPDSEPGRLYASRCASCHGTLRQGNYRSEREVDVAYAPTLIGTTRREASRDAYEIDSFRRRHERLTSEHFEQAELDRLVTMFRELDHEIERSGNLSLGYVATQLLDDQGFPGSRPPWGEIVALDLASGRIQWRVPFGEYAELTRRGLPKTGQPNFGGLIATRGGLIFATGTIDTRVRALDEATGKELWSYELPAAGSAPPTTFAIDGRQFLAVVATGGRFHGFDARASRIVAFALPEDEAR